ncbi:hypothetical protein [Rossellomorea aquimaris]|uniref:Uncharacterized protein n=1 Tax=Rossellomorea aquimaris TaxID=189382 RepID=A0A366EQU9_9BACI|nr:hypothetical protein [Rossellomorea aquimaris]RBP04751.1 hypothetical protein DET59_10538 [Rossellomorea aquimaris]
MGDQNKGRKISVIGDTKSSLTGKVKWIPLRQESTLVFSTKNNGKQRVIYYSQNSFTSEGTDKRDFLLIDRIEK